MSASKTLKIAAIIAVVYLLFKEFFDKKIYKIKHSLSTSNDAVKTVAITSEEEAEEVENELNKIVSKYPYAYDHETDMDSYVGTQKDKQYLMYIGVDADKNYMTFVGTNEKNNYLTYTGIKPAIKKGPKHVLSVNFKFRPCLEYDEKLKSCTLFGDDVIISAGEEVAVNNTKEEPLDNKIQKVSEVLYKGYVVKVPTKYIRSISVKEIKASSSTNMGVNPSEKVKNESLTIETPEVIGKTSRLLLYDRIISRNISDENEKTKALGLFKSLILYGKYLEEKFDDSDKMSAEDYKRLASLLSFKKVKEMHSLDEKIKTASKEEEMLISKRASEIALESSEKLAAIMAKVDNKYVRVKTGEKSGYSQSSKSGNLTTSIDEEIGNVISSKSTLSTQDKFNIQSMLNHVPSDSRAFLVSKYKLNNRLR